MYKVKSQPEDFIVEEILGVTPQPRGAYHLYLVQKRNLNTTDVVARIAEEFRVPRESIAYGGRKDKHAVATQHLSVFSKSALPKSVEQQNFKMHFAGFLDRPMGPDLIEKNKFTLALRNLTAQSRQKAEAELVSVKRFGYPNYFDDQRFGSYDDRQGFLAEKVLKKHDNGAVKIYVTRYGSENDKRERERKNKLIFLWGDWNACLKIAANDFEKNAFIHLQAHPKDFRSILRKIPRDELSGFFTAYQAYLWNDILRRYLTQRISPLKISPGRLGPYVFFDTLSEQEEGSFKNMLIPLPAGRTPQHPQDIRSIFENILKEQGIKNSLFNLKTIRHAFFKAVPRPVLAIPQEMHHEALEDDLNAGREKMILVFTLPRGCYATMLVKRIFSHDQT